MAYRAEFIEGLALIVSAIEEMAAQGYSKPVLVGGAAVEFWTGSAITSGDFDMVTENQKVLESILLQKGFQRPQGTGALLRGLHHPTLQIGLEVVSGPLFDGLVPQDRLVMVTFDQGSLIVISVEDAIADRLGQYASHEPSGAAMLNQAVQLFRLASEIDESYLETRVRQETAQTYGLDFLKDQVESYENHLICTNRR